MKGRAAAAAAAGGGGYGYRGGDSVGKNIKTFDSGRCGRGVGRM